MLAAQSHIIQKMRLDFDFPAIEAPHDIPGHIQTLVNTSLLPQLGAILDNQGLDEKYISIEKIDLELELEMLEFESDAWEELLTKTFQEEIWKVLSRHRGGDGQNVKVRSKYELIFEQLRYFLEHGIFPKWGIYKSWEELEKHSLELLTSDDSKNYLQQLAIDLSNSSGALRRLKNQGSTKFLFRLHEAWEKTSSPNLRVSPPYKLLWQKVKKLKTAIEDESFQGNGQLLLGLLLEDILRKNKNHHPTTSERKRLVHLKNELINGRKALQPLAKQLIQIIEDMLVKAKEISKPVDIQKEFNSLTEEKISREEIQKDTDKADIPFNRDPSRAESKAPDDYKKNKLINKDGSIEINDIKKTIETDESPKDGLTAEQGKVEKDEEGLKPKEMLNFEHPLSLAGKEKLRFPEKDIAALSMEEDKIGNEDFFGIQEVDRRSLKKLEKEPVFIENAGILLLHPFLEMFFEQTGLMQESSFLDQSSQEQAIQLLQIAATGQAASEEQLFLNKLLCDWPLHEPLNRNILIPKSSKKEVKNLLDSVIEHWGVLKNTDPDALREAFLRRKGKVEKIGNDWHIQVGQSSLDILLTKLPWALSPIHLPWMDHLIFCTWT